MVSSSDNGRVSVLHEWSHTDVRGSSGITDEGSEDIELSAFLSETKPNAIQAELRRLIGTLVEGAQNA